MSGRRPGTNSRLRLAFEMISMLMELPLFFPEKVKHLLNCDGSHFF